MIERKKAPNMLSLKRIKLEWATFIFIYLSNKDLCLGLMLLIIERTWTSFYWAKYEPSIKLYELFTAIIDSYI